MKKILNALKHPAIIWFYCSRNGLLSWMSDEKYLKKMFKMKLGYELNLNNPRTFNEKLQWLKLYDRKPEYTRMVDKYEVKKYVSERIGEEYIIPTLGVWDKFEDIDFDSLPEQFVLKCTHDSQSIVICKNKNELDYKTSMNKLNRCLKNNGYNYGREWPYKNVTPRIIAEKYLDDNSGDAIQDFKFFCFGGEPKIMYVSRDKSKEPRTDFFDMDFNHLNMRMRDKNSDILPEKPKMFEQMKALATILSKGIPHVSVDFYCIEEKIYFGELTFFHCSGLAKINPIEWEYTLGDWIELPEKTNHAKK